MDICDSNKYYNYSHTMIEDNCLVDTIKNKVTHISFVMKSNQYLLKLYSKLQKEFSNLEIIIMQDSGKERRWIEIMPKGCTKYNAIHKLANDLQIKNEDIIAFGDGLNDIEMLKNCGIGVAMKNALKEVKEVADKITEYSNTEDGVIRFLDEYLNKID